ncbi:MAG: helix-turn-helix domain-containing protein [Ruminococcaceae bacterium]|nr:helix-turn-helix domain-containing protein [Oscillospiraceae bacterium]
MNRVEENIIWTDVFDGDSTGRNMLESHSHPFFELSFVACGDVTILFDDKKYQADGSCVIFSLPKTNHHILVEAGRYFRYNAYFYNSGLEALPQYELKLHRLFKKGGNVVFLSKNGAKRLLQLFPLLECESDENKPLLLALIISTVFKEAEQEGAYGKQKENYIDDVLRYILKDYDKKIIADDLASQFFVSRTKLMTDFKSKTGKTLVEQITFVRVEQAKALLSSGRSVYDTAISCGFVNAGNFTRVFKRYVGKTPKEYQKEGIF